MAERATYQEIQNYIKANYGFCVKTCWIAHCKELCGLPVKSAPNRIDKNVRTNSCPEKYAPIIRDAFRHFGMI